MADDPVTERAATKNRRSRLRRILGAGLFAAAAYAVWRAIEANRDEHDSGWRAQPFPFPPEPRRHADDPGTADPGAGPEPDRG